MQSAALSTAERLVKEYKSNDPYKVSILENMVLVSTKHKPNVERALASFVDICQKKVVLYLLHLCNPFDLLLF